MKSVNLVLTHDFNLAVKWINAQSIPNVYVIDERELAKENKSKFQHGFLDIDYSSQMVELMKVKRLSYKSSRPLIMLMDMRHQDAVVKIPHDHSILIYDGSLSKKLAYHPTYTVNLVVDNIL